MDIVLKKKVIKPLFDEVSRKEGKMDNKEFTKQKAKDLFEKLIGRSDELIQLTPSSNSWHQNWSFTFGDMKYSAFKLDDRIFIQFCMRNLVVGQFYYNFETLEPDFEFTEENMRKT